MKLNVGCGNMPLEGYKNIDISHDSKAEAVYDASKQLLEEPESMEEINCGCMMEQIESNADFVNFLNECHRVLKEGGIMKGYVPSTDPRVMHLDPMDKRFFQLGTFEYFDKSKHHWQEFGRVYGFKGWSRCEAQLNENGIIHFTMTK